MEIALALVVLFFALWGLSDCLRYVAIKIVVPKNKVRRFIVPVQNIDGYYDLVSEIELIRWHNDRNPILLVIDLGMDTFTKQLCEKAAEENPFIIFCKPEEAAYIIK